MSEETAEPPVLSNAVSPGRRNLRPPWKPGQSGNPKGRPPYRRLFEEAFARGVTENAEAIVEALVKKALAGDAGMMRPLLERVLPRLERHEIDAGAAPSRMVIEFAQPTTAKEPDDGDDG